MSTLVDDTAGRMIPATEIVDPRDPFDPTAGAVAVSRELAAEQVSGVPLPTRRRSGWTPSPLTTFRPQHLQRRSGAQEAALFAVVLPFALLFGGLVQLLAGMWEFRKGNVFGATVGLHLLRCLLVVVLGLPHLLRRGHHRAPWRGRR